MSENRDKDEDEYPRFNKRKLNPIGFHLLALYNNPEIRFIICPGGSSSGKSYGIAQTILIQTLHDHENTLVMRKVGASIKDSIYEDFKVAAAQLHIYHFFKFKDGSKTIDCLLTGARIVFKGLDDPEKIKGVANFKRVVMDELSEFELADFKQMRKRLRGKKGQQIIGAFNPIKETHWIKTDFVDKAEWIDMDMSVTLLDTKIPEVYTKVKSLQKNKPRYILDPRTKEVVEHPSDSVIITTTYLNNLWVVGSWDGKYGYYDEQCIADFEYDRIHDPDYYRVYALAEWGVIRTGSEFFGSFNRGVHVVEPKFNPDLPVHLSVDNNVLPYISCSYWQIDMTDGIHIHQFDETCAGNPDNTVRKAAALVAKKLKGYGVDSVFLHGDASTKAANTIDEEKRSFLDLFIDTLQKHGITVTDCVSGKNPPVALSGEFINAIYENNVKGVTLTIGENCKVSIEDYLSVQKDVNGAILKTRIKNKITMQTYEEHGHLSDTKRYLVCDALKDEFTAFNNRRKRNLLARDGMIHFYNPEGQYKYSEDALYCLPDSNGKFVYVRGMMCGERWHITSAGIIETNSTTEMADVLRSEGCACVVVECGQPYYPFVRELREEIEDVRLYKEAADVDRRIAATSDFVRSHVLFDEERTNGDERYASFMTSLLDYNKDSESKEASAALSGFVRFAIKSFAN